ncbi:uncharacterized protein LOC103370451 isoform X2 [Stegastes partitus]|uniref:Uncharacterized protein LOC103370451 isoform X2 n=1 Tax=Stegastes partitus TaxID=144197 RepID=A0A9Y4NI33_9TELE|nr:PREDICTED: uncharacterized protein LOC103370451 isoform X2 [Stegastes partitus]
MHQKLSNMLLSWMITFGWLIYGSITVEPALGANKNPNCDRKLFHGTMYDSREAVVCGTRLHVGAGLSCCGDQPFNPATATCCKTEHEANVTQDLSEKVSTCCGLTAFNALNEICCDSTVAVKNATTAECCGKAAYDKDKQLCCRPDSDPVILEKTSPHHRCCRHKLYDFTTQCCHWKNDTHVEVKPKPPKGCDGNSVKTTHGTCGQKTYNTHTEMCCGSLVIPKMSAKERCCGEGAYNYATECCCWPDHGPPERKPKTSPCCAVTSVVPHLTPEPPPSCSEPNTHVCGSSCYNPNERRCCERKETKPHWCCASGQCDAAPTVYNPHTHVCCDGCISELKPGMDQCCGDTPYGSAQRGLLCCHNVLYKDREDGEECSDAGIPYNPAKGTMCYSQFHASPGQHCCGAEVYRPLEEICCGGHRYPKRENLQCCGVKAYNITDPNMKCCKGTLYDLTHLGNHGHDAKCCGSVLQNPQKQEVCCSSKDEAVLYPKKTGFGCCGHLYFNSFLWSCCAGVLRPGHKQQSGMNECRLLSVNNLKDTELCREIYIGTVESVSLNSILFRNVLKLDGRNGTVQPVPFHHILMTPNRCTTTKLIVGKFYFFHDVNVFADFNHDTVIQSLHFFFSKCSL